MDRLAELDALAEDPDLWNRPSDAQKLMKERNRLQHSISSHKDLEAQLDDGMALIQLGEEAEDAETIEEAERIFINLQLRVRQKEIESLLSGELDANDCYLEVNAGAGGTEAQDWAEMLLRMYMRWAEQRNYKVFLIDETVGEVAGIKSATIQIQGTNAYGWLKTESGVHRLVRISPYDSNARRHTSFSAVNVYPEIDDTINIEVLDKDLRVDTYRASGAGGQHVNKTDSAVRLTHIPTGIVVACQQERSQHKNRDKAMQMLKARLYERELKIHEEKVQSLQAEKSDIGWGHQIRSYVLQPYQLVKDLRTNIESGNPQAVLDGKIDEFLEAALAAKIRAGDTD